jgi:hypothetical protein
VTDEQPSLSSLVRWFASEVGDAIPVRLHSRDTDSGGVPEFHQAFVQWLDAPDGALDREGYIKFPLRYWISRMGDQGRAGKRARFCWLLAQCDFDWRRAAFLNKSAADDDAAHDYARATLLRLRGLMYDADGTPHQPVISKRGQCAEKGCVNKTSHYRCRDHEKSESQHRAEEAA